MTCPDSPFTSRMAAIPDATAAADAKVVATVGATYADVGKAPAATMPQHAGIAS